MDDETETEPAPSMNDLMRGRLADDHARLEDLAARVVGAEDEDETGDDD